MAAEDVEKVVSELAATEPPAEEGEADENAVAWYIAYTTYRN